MRRQFPGGFEDAIAVSSINEDGKKSSFSNYGPWVDVAAPGDQIISTLPGGEYGPESGTSMASPVVAGLAAMLAATNPQLSTQDLKDIIIGSANPEIYDPNSNSGYNYSFYFPDLGNDGRWPLLGSGSVDFAAMVGGTRSGKPIPVANNRVTPGCGMIGNHREGEGESEPSGGGLGIQYLLLLLPACLVVFKFRSKKNPISKSH